tara:strand:+ start:870 stop:1847 length:978 start_codon:yes stop_codon:yes gene_type:complete
MTKLSTVILGATGLVGQRLQQRLEDHPLFEVVAISGSKSTVGKKYSQLEWRLEGKRPNFEITICNIDEIPDVDVAFSALPSDIAETIEPKLVGRGIHVFSNASTYRMTQGVPLVIPEINPDEMDGYSGHACATNCTVIPVAMPLSGLTKFGINSVKINTMQALSGAGWELLFDESALAGNVDRFIPGEEEKVLTELNYLLNLDCPISVSCNRVAEPDGHIVEVELELEDIQDIDSIKDAMIIPRLELPSSPQHPVMIIDDVPNRDQHLWAGGEGLDAGMATVVGGIKVDGSNVTFTALSHNTVRGAAGGVILLAEFAAQLGYISK